YAELQSIARRTLRTHGRGDQLRTTVLVHECYLRLVDHAAAAQTRNHFLALCARVMQQLIVDSARRSTALKRGGDAIAVTLDGVDGQHALQPESLAVLDQALTALDQRDPRLARIAECRIFAGMDSAEIADAFGLTERSVQREWNRVRALLSLALEEAG